MATENITKRLVDAIGSAERDRFVWDRDVGGFGLKVTPLGRKTYVLQYRMGGRGTPTKRFTIGRHGSPWTPDTARNEARSILEKVRRGIDPNDARRQRPRVMTENPFDEYVARFLSQYATQHWKPKTFASAESNLRRYVLPALKSRSLNSITRADIVALIDSIPASSPALARSVFAHTRRVFSWAVARGDRETSPFDGMSGPSSSPSRERVLTDTELASVWHGTYNIPIAYGTLVRLLILTGQRRDEVAGMQWPELDRASKTWTLPRSRTKNGRTHVVPLSDAAWEEVEAIAVEDWPARGHVFMTKGTSYISGFSNAKAHLDQAIASLRNNELSSFGLDPWRLHDIRRTFATGMQRLGVRFEVTEALLNHVSGAKSGVAGVYQRHEWLAEKREAIGRWAALIVELASPTHGQAQP